MQTSQIISLLLFLSGWISCFPTKPLNERSTELTWQAWLLIDESQNKHQDNSLRRRITPKSVFIAPTFSPENFPECSEGYQSDSMGRCIKIIMLNKENHLDFLLQQLNDKFGGSDDYEDEEGTTAGPLNINIPLLGMAQEEDTDVAIVVAPTNGIVQTKTQIKPIESFTGAKVNVGDIAGILGLKQAAEVETTTITGTSTVNIDSTTEESTTKNVEATTVNFPGTTSEFNALFFLDPKRQVEIKTDNYDSSTATTTLDFEATDTNIINTTKKMKVATSNGVADKLTDLPFLQMDQALPYSDAVVNFADTKREAIKSNIHGMNDSPSDTFKTKSPTTKDETGKDNTYQQVSPNGQSFKPSKEMKLSPSTIAPNVLTPIDNSFTNYKASTISQSVLRPTESILSVEYHTPSYGTLSNNNKKVTSNVETVGTNKNESSLQETTPQTSTTEIITTYTAQDTSTTSNITSGNEASVYSTAIPQVTVTTENLLSASVQNKVKFPTDSSHIIRFPTESSVFPKETSTSVNHMLDVSKRFEAIFNQYGSSRGADPSENNRHVFRNNPGLPLSPELSQTVRQRYNAHINNHRNREKYSEWYQLPSKWIDTSQKPVVLRFSKKHGYIDSQQLGSNNFYREINPKLFNFPPTSRDHR